MACSTHGERRDSYRILEGRTEGKSPIEKPGRRWEDNHQYVGRWAWTELNWLHVGTVGRLLLMQ